MSDVLKGRVVKDKTFRYIKICLDGSEGGILGEIDYRLIINPEGKETGISYTQIKDGKKDVLFEIRDGKLTLGDHEAYKDFMRQVDLSEVCGDVNYAPVCKELTKANISVEEKPTG